MVWRDAPRSSHLDSSAPPMRFCRRRSHSEKQYRSPRMPAQTDRAPRRRITGGSSSPFQDRGPISQQPTFPRPQSSGKSARTTKTAQHRAQQDRLGTGERRYQPAQDLQDLPDTPDQMNRRPTSWPQDTSTIRRWLRSVMPCERMSFRLPRRSTTH